MDVWDQMQHWDLVLPPSRPSVVQLARIRSYIHHIEKFSPVAVLGSTPEYRDLLNENGFKNIYIFERNVDFYKAMSQIRIYQNPEHLVEGDWLQTLPKHKSMFSLILSDLTSGNVSYNDRRNFYGLITESLSKGGIFSDKVLTHAGPNLRVDELIQKYADLPLNLLCVNYFSCEMLFCSELLDIKQMVDSSHFYSVLNERVNNIRVQAFLQHAQKITPPDCKWYYGRKWEQLEGDYCPSLKRVAVDEDEQSSPYYGRLKFFIHVKEK